MKTNSYFFKNFLVFLFFIFTSITFGQTDACTSPTVLTLGTSCTTTNYSIAKSFTDENVTFCSGTAESDGWYQFTTGPSTNAITINTTASSMQVGVALYTNACPGTSLACTIPGGTSANLTSISVSPSTTYFIRIMRTSGGNKAMSGTICVYDSTVCSGTPTAGTTTVSPTSGAAGSTYTVSNTGHATGSGITYQWQYSTNGGGTWTNQGAATSTYANTTATAPASGTVIWRLAVTCTASGQTSYSTTATFSVLAGMTNDNCSGAIPLTINTSCSYTNYTNVGATASSGVPAPGCASYSGGDVWFSFVVPANGTVTVDTQTGSITDSGMAWYTGTCGSLTLLECDDDDSANGTMSSITRTGLTPGTTIYVRFWDYNDGFGSFGICATSPGACTTPGSQATGFTAGTITSNSFPATFSGIADSYLVIRSTSATPPSNPVNGVVYTGANIGTLGTGLTLVQNGTSTTIPGTGLTGNTRYYYYIYAYNNSGCSGGPLYNASGPLTGNAVTCPATPSPVTTSSTLTSINFSWPSSLGGGINAVTYQLQVTTDAGYTANVGASPFTINNPTTTFNLTGLTANTTYYYRIRAGNGCWSTYTTGTATTGYCAPAPTSVDGTGIINVTLGTINNTTGAEAGNYGNYSAMSTSGTLGQTIPFSIRFSTAGFSYETIIWIDWNNDLDFNDPGEVVFTGTSAATDPATLTGSFQIPGSATIGNHRIRIGGLDSGTPTPCYTGSYGTYEDYTLTVTAPPACTGTPSAGITSVNPITGWPGSTYIVSTSGYSIASNLTYQWQSSTDAGATWTNVGASTSSYTNYIATAPASGVVLWRLRVTCTNSSQFANSTTGTFTTLAVSDVATGCPNVVSGGLGLNGADPAPFDCTATATCVDLEATYLDLGNTTNYIVEPIAYNPPFAFTGLANPIVLGTDDYWSSQIVNLPFKFCYFGNTYDQVLPGPNGALTFNTSLVGTSAGYSFSNNLPSTTGALFNNTIYGVYHDINSTYGGQFGWELITLPTGCRALVVAYNNVPMFSDNAILYSGMIVLYENSNIIEVYVKEKKIDNNNISPWNGGNAIIGLQNSDGTIAVVPPGRNGLDPNWEATGEAWRFVPNGTSIASIAWYQGPTATGPVLGTNDILNVCPTATTTYTAEITYTLCDGRTIKETDTTTVTVNGAKTWNGSVSTNWNVANNWTPAGVPTAMDCVVIADTANDPIISGTNYNGLGLNLTVNNNATLTVTPNNDLTITDWVNINTTGDLVLQNSASLIQVNNTPNQGTMHMTRTANIRKLDYVYWSSPVTSFSVNSISPGTTGYKYK